MIHEIGERVFDNAFKNREAKSGDLFLVYQGDGVLAREDSEHLWYPSFADFEKERPELKDDARYLFSIDDIHYFRVTDDGLGETDGWTFVQVDRFRTDMKYWRAYAGAVGWQLDRWYRDQSFCSRCARPMNHSHKERMLYCDSCGFQAYPKISPCVIVAVCDGDRMLLTKYARRAYSKYSLVAGFVEIGETLEQAVHREVMEEVGLKVKNLTYYKSQPWPFSDTILAGFFAQLDGSDLVTLQEEELVLGTWVNREDVPHDELKISLTGEMMDAFRLNKVSF